MGRVESTTELPGSETSGLQRAVAARVREELAMRQIPQTELARLIGISQSGASRRLRGVTPFDLNELAAIATAIGKKVTDLIPAARADAA